MAKIRRISSVGAAAIALILIALPGAAVAGSPWHQITASGDNIDQVGLARTGDGALHVAWLTRTGGNSYDLRHTPISPGGSVGSATPIVSGWASLDNPALVTDPSGALRVLFGGIHTTNFGDPNQDLNTAVSSNAGASWVLQPGDVAAPGSPAYSSPVGATAVGAARFPYETWFGTLGVWVHAGLSPASPNFNYQTPFGCCGYDSNLASAPSGSIVVAWFSNATGHLGVYAEGVAPDGSPVGSPTNMPGTSNMSVGQLGRTPIVARPDGDFYIAYATGYPALNRVRLWRFGSGTSTTIAKVPTSGEAADATVAVAPDGRLWVIWKQDVRFHPHVFAVRSNKAANRFGAVVDAGAPPDAASAYRLDGNAITSGLDLFGSFSRGTSSSVSTWYRRLLPGLSVHAQPATLHRGRGTKITFLVTDAGAPVKGAKVSAARRSGTTNSKGAVTFEVTAQHGVTVTAGHAGYVAARTSLKVVR